MSKVQDVIGLWPSASEFARDIGLKRESHATVFKARGSIPLRYWPRIVEAAKRRGFTLEFGDLVSAHVGAPALAESNASADWPRDACVPERRSLR